MPSNPFNQGFLSSEELADLGFRSIGTNVMIARNSTIIGLENISIASNVRIDANVLIAAAFGSLEIGSYVHIGAGSHLACIGGIKFCDFSGISQGVKIYSGTDDFSGKFLTNPTVPQKLRGMKLAPVLLGRHVIVGSGSIIFPGVSIGEGSAVGALSLVTKSLDCWGVYYGNPAKFLKRRKRDLLELEKRL